MDEKTAADAAALPPAVPLPNLVLSLEQATLLARQLPSASNPNHLHQIYSALRLAQHHLSSFLLSHSQLPPQPEENSVSSATEAGENNGSEPMQIGEDGEEGNSMAAIDKVVERMTECFIKNKRPKRPLSPSSASLAEERRLGDDGYVAGTIKGYDPFETRLRALDLIDKFHA